MPGPLDIFKIASGCADFLRDAGSEIRSFDEDGTHIVSADVTDYEPSIISIELSNGEMYLLTVIEA